MLQPYKPENPEAPRPIVEKWQLVPFPCLERGGEMLRWAVRVVGSGVEGCGVEGLTLNPKP